MVVTGTERSGEAETEVLPWAHGEGLSPTLEMPTTSPDPGDSGDDHAEDAPAASGTDAAPLPRDPEAPAAVPVTPPAPAAITVAPPAPAIPLVAALSRPTVAETPPPPPPNAAASAGPQHPTRPPQTGERQRLTRRWVAVMGALVVLAAGGGAVAARWPADVTRGAQVQAADQVIKPASVTSLDPSGGSGLRQAGDRWRTQTYVSADFGNLKDGVGLVMDLGSARSLTGVSVDVGSAPIVIELRAADKQSSSVGDFQPVSGPQTVEASGTTTLTAADGGSHRYWLVWITRLAPQDGGYGAVIGTPTVRGSAG